MFQEFFQRFEYKFKKNSYKKGKTHVEETSITLHPSADYIAMGAAYNDLARSCADIRETATGEFISLASARQFLLMAGETKMPNELVREILGSTLCKELGIK